jgi:hypothetical protein
MDRGNSILLNTDDGQTADTATTQFLEHPRGSSHKHKLANCNPAIILKKNKDYEVLQQRHPFRFGAVVHLLRLFFSREGEYAACVCSVQDYAFTICAFCVS